MRPANLKTKIFLDSGDPEETSKTIKILGFLDGQTTNPTLVAKNPSAAGQKFSKKELFDLYKDIITKISNLIPEGSISIEVEASKDTTSDEMYDQAKDMFTWIPNAHIKFPTTTQGLTAAQRATNEGLRLNMTLCFSQAQAAAVYAATSNTPPPALISFKNVFVSPFIGRLDDRGENGMNLIENIIKMYSESDHHVEVLTASVRNLNHFLFAIKIGSDIITAPIKVLEEWAREGLPIPDENFTYDSSELKPIKYKKISLNKNLNEYDIHHDLTNIGIEKFTNDWNSLVLS